MTVALLKNDLETFTSCRLSYENRNKAKYEYQCNDFSRLLVFEGYAAIENILVLAFREPIWIDLKFHLSIEL